MRITETGDIGIGTTNPWQKLHVIGNVLLTGSSSSLLFGDGGTNPWGNWGIEYQDAGQSSLNCGGLNFWKPYGCVGAYGNYFLFLKDNGNVGIGTENPQQNLDVQGNAIFSGNVGVGVNNPLYNLDVCGTIHSKEWIVELFNCPDYVFENDYELKPFIERINEIKKNKKLPYILSANEMKLQGAPMRDSFTGLLRNTEELFLYTGQLEERLTKAEAENKELKILKDEYAKKIEILDSRMQVLEKKIEIFEQK